MLNQLSFLYLAARDFLEPLRRSLSNRDALEYLLFSYGWNISLEEAIFELIDQRSNIRAPLDDFLQQADVLQETLSSAAETSPTSEQLAALAESAQKVLRAIAGFKLSNLDSLPEPLNESSFWTDIGGHILDDLLENYLRIHYSYGYLFLHCFGVIRYDLIHPTEPHRRPYTRTVVDWGQAIEVIKNPLQAFRQAYHWDDPVNAFEHQRLFASLEKVLRAIRISASLTAPDAKTLSNIPSVGTYDVKSDDNALWVQFVYEISPSGATVYEFGMEVLPARRTTQNEASGLLIRPVLRSGSETNLAVSPNLRLEWSPTSDAGDVLVVVLFPEQLEWVVGPVTSEARLEFTSRSSSPRYLIGNAETTRIEVSDVSAGLSIEGGADSPEIKLYLKTSSPDGSPGCKVVIPIGEADGFIKEISDRDAIEFPFAVQIIWSNKTGLTFNGDSVVDIILPLRIEMGRLVLQDARLALRERETPFSNSALELKLGTGLQGQLGPIRLVISGIGFSLTTIRYSDDELLELPQDQEPLFGKVDLQLGFAPPIGVGLAIDGGGFKGGGFLRFEPDHERYAGILELEYQDRIELKAIGLLTTSLPGGVPGFSLLIIITAEFEPIQLGLGFTLNAVGGLLGLNRTAHGERLRTGLRDNTLRSILFPENIIANADRIISDLRQVFPPQDGRFLFGPMAKIGWGSPTLITVDLGLLIEVPQPVRVFILGVARGLLPDEKAKLLQIQVNFLGEIDFDRELFAFDASLFDSKLLTYTLSGDMAARLKWGDSDPNFLLTVGGFHPAYNPPPLALPVLQRLTVQLLKGNNPRLVLETYFAVTSNTAQFGARVELYAAAGKFNVYGFLSFDALFQFNPFYFIADVAAMLALRVGSSSIASIQLSLTLEGTTPWKAQGTATLKLCWFIKIKVRFNKTFGEVRDTRLDDVAVLPLLRAALSDKGNWSAEIPAGRHLLVSVKEINDVGNQVVAHPFGILEISQRAVPLNVEIQKFGNQRPADGNRFAIEQVRVGEPDDTEPLGTSSVREQFAPAQFFEMTDAEKLSRKSFEGYEGGVRATASERLEAAYAAKREVDYDLFYIDSQREQRLRPWADRLRPDAVAFDAWASKGAVAASPLSFANNKKSALAPEAVRVIQEQFAVVKTSDLTPVNGAAVADSEAGAFGMMRELIRSNPALEGEIQVVPTFEVNRL